MEPWDANLNRTDLYYGLFVWRVSHDGRPRVSRRSMTPASIPCPTTGRLLKIATIDADAAAICPSCATEGYGGFVSFEGDLRMAYACPECQKLVWVAGA